MRSGCTLDYQDRPILDTPESRMDVAEQIRRYRPRLVFTTEGCGIHPDHKAITEIVTNGVFYARLPKWEEVPGGERLAETEPHEIERLFFGLPYAEPFRGRSSLLVEDPTVFPPVRFG